MSRGSKNRNRIAILGYDPRIKKRPLTPEEFEKLQNEFNKKNNN